jgi:epoxyqueuosine reductase
VEKVEDTANSVGSLPPDLFYKHKSVSVDHLKELQAEIDKLKNEGKLSGNKVYRSYLSDLKFEMPRNLPEAKSVIVIAVFTKLMLVNFHLHGRKHEIMLPHYYEGGERTCADNGLKKIVMGNECKFERAWVNLKLLAVRSGLGEYGRNNLCYVEGMGSLLKLFAYFTDYHCEDSWSEAKIMDCCQDCGICMSNCPNNCITKENFVIDAGRCLSLYNEIGGEFPEWINTSAHNAIMGCLRCQLCCPANRDVVKQTGRLEDITEEETAKILNGKPDKVLLESLSKKLKGFTPTRSEELFPVLTRNLRVLLKTETNRTRVQNGADP